MNAVETVDAVVIGSGHNGLVAAASLADAGLDVLILEGQDTPGGAVRSAELTPGYTADLFSAFYPMARASPALLNLELEHHGLQWSRSPVVFGHARFPGDDDAPVVYPDRTKTASELARRDPRDGQAWMDLTDQWLRIKRPLLSALFGASFPPVRGAAGLARVLGAADMLEFVRFMALPARVMAHELFAGDAARVLLLGNAMHGDSPIDAPVSGVMGWLLMMLAQDTGFDVPVGGSGGLTNSLVRRAAYPGAQLRCGDPVVRIDVEGGRATAVHTLSGRHIRARKAILADVSAPALYTSLLPRGAVPNRVYRALDRFEWDTPVVKINYALDAKIPWRSASLGGAGTVHLGADEPGLVRWMADLTTGAIPSNPFLLFGQMTTSDPARSPAGTESAWAYTHLPRGVVDDASADLLASRVDDVMEAHAPGFASHIVGKFVQRPSDLTAADANLIGGAVNGGTGQLHQQLIFRPTPGLGRSETPIQGLYLASASAHPGGGVHGACGLNAARAALSQQGRRGWVRRKTMSTVIDLLTRDPRAVSRR